MTVQPVELSIGAQIGMARNQVALDRQLLLDRQAAVAAAELAAQRAAHAEWQRQEQARAAAKLLDMIGKKPGKVRSVSPVNGGPSAWGGTAVGVPSPPRMRIALSPSTLSQTGSPTVAGGGGRGRGPTPQEIRAGIKVLWEGGKWVFKKADKYILEPMGRVVTARDIWNWSQSNVDTPNQMPARVRTEYSFRGGQILYQHFDGRMLDYPPNGYDEFGRAMWVAR